MRRIIQLYAWAIRDPWWWIKLILTGFVVFLIPQVWIVLLCVLVIYGLLPQKKRPAPYPRGKYNYRNPEPDFNKRKATKRFFGGSGKRMSK